MAEKITPKLKSKIVFKCRDDTWESLRVAHRRKYPKDNNSMEVALTRAIEEFVKNGE